MFLFGGTRVDVNRGDTITLKNHRRLRLSILFGASVIIATIPFSLLVVIPSASGEVSNDIAFPLVVGYLVLVPLAFGLWMIMQVIRFVDIEIAPGLVRLPFHRYLKRFGWRELSEIVTMASPDSEEAVGRIRRAIQESKVAPRRFPSAAMLLRTWRNAGGLFVVTYSEILYLRIDPQLARRVQDHWSTAPDPNSTGGTPPQRVDVSLRARDVSDS